jgi:hypothetical protein
MLNWYSTKLIDRLVRNDRFNIPCSNPGRCSEDFCIRYDDIEALEDLYSLEEGDSKRQNHGVLALISA